MTTGETKKAPPLEKHLQTVLQGLIATLVLWLGTTVNQAQVEIAKLTVAMETVRAEISGLQSRTEDRYTGQQAREDWQRFDDRISALEARTSRLEPHH